MAVVAGARCHGLDVESGLNDGLALPFFVLALAAAGGGHGDEGVGETFLRALLLSSAIGLAAVWAAARLLRWPAALGWAAHGWRQLASPAVPAVAYPLAVEAEGSGFIAVWIAGLAFGNVLRKPAAPVRDADAGVSEMRPVRRDHSGPGAGARDLADAGVRRAEPDLDPDAPGRRSPARNRTAAGDPRLHRLVRSPWTGLRGVRPAGCRRAPAGHPRPRRRSRVDGRLERLPARSHRSAAVGTPRGGPDAAR